MLICYNEEKKSFIDTCWNDILCEMGVDDPIVKMVYTKDIVVKISEEDSTCGGGGFNPKDHTIVLYPK